MDVQVPDEVRTELIQILSNLVLGDNEIRANAEKAVDDRLAKSPEPYLLALAQSACSADTEVMRSFSLVLLRRLLLRTTALGGRNATEGQTLSLYDQLPASTLSAIEQVLLHSVAHESATVVRHKAVDTVIDIANRSVDRGRPWHALQVQSFAMVNHADAGARESAFRIFAGCPVVILDLQTSGTLELLQKGLQDQNTDVRHAALRATVAYIQGCDEHQVAQSVGIMHPLLETLPPLAPAQLTQFLQALLPLASARPNLFAPHLQPLLAFLSALLLSQADIDPGPTPTVSQPFPGSGGSAFSFDFPPAGSAKGKTAVRPQQDEEREEARKAALEFVLTLSEEKPAMVRRVEGWAAAIVRGCLEGMGELDDDDTDEWRAADPSEDSTDDDYPHVYEQGLDRLACALGGKVVLPPAFQYIPAMLSSHDWKHRHAGLMAIANLAEGTAQFMRNELGKVVDLVTTTFRDEHPRVRYAACQCVGQLCTDLEEVIQEQYHQQLFSVLIPTLEDPEPRVHSHAAAALVNFCEGVEHDTLVPYIDPIFERLLKLLSPGTGKEPTRRYVQEQAITSLAMVADASETTFAKHYSSIMPLLLDALENANGPDYRKLRQKAMECAGLIAIAVGRDIFRQDSDRFVEALMRIQNAPVDPTDTMLGHYLIATWAKLCQAMGTDFEAYLPVVMPPLLQAAAVRAELSVYDEDQEEDREGWETITMDGQQIGIRTSAIEEKCQAFETLVIHCSTLGARFAPYLMQSLELALPALRFYFHEGVREAACLLIPMLITCGMQSSTLTPEMVYATFRQLVTCIGTENDASFVASLYKCFADCAKLVGGPSAVPDDAKTALVEVSKRQLQVLAEKRKRRGGKTALEIEDEREDLALFEELEGFALDDMEKTLQYLDPSHPLLVAVSGVRQLGLGLNQWEDEEV